MKTRLNPVRANVSNVVLGQGATFAIMEVKGEKYHGRLNFSVDEVEELWEKLKYKVEIVETLFDTPLGTKRFTIRDLEGNELGFGR